METYRKLKRKYYWPKIIQHITNFINLCQICKENKYDRKPIQLEDNLTPTPEKPFDIINIDILTLDKNYYLTIFDQFSKFAKAYFCKNKTSNEILKHLISFCNVYKLPQIIIADSGCEFNNTLLKIHCHNNNIKLHITSVNNPKSNAVERFHSTLIEYLRIIYKENPHKNIKELIEKARYGYNNSINAITLETPQEILFGKENFYKIPKEINSEEQKLENYIKQRKEMNIKIKNLIEKEKLKRNKENKSYENFEEVNKAYLKQNPRLITKFKQPLFKKVNVRNYDDRTKTIEVVGFFF